MSTKKSLVSGALALLLALTACSGGTGSSSSSAVPAGETNRDPIDIEIMISYDGVEFPQPGNDAQRAIEEFTNTKLNITAYPGATLHELLPTMIASDELPMVIGYGGSQLSKVYMINAIRAGVFWNVAPYLKQFPNISQLKDIVFENYTVDGIICGLPKERGLCRDAVGYRADWLEKLGMEEPSNVEELYQMLVAFTKNDPDGNGQDDTFGSCNSPLGRFAIHLGAPNVWRYEDGKMVRAELTEEYMQALDMTRELYEMGAIHKEFAILERSQYEALFTEGKAGAYFNINNFAQLAMAQPEADIHVNGVFPSEKGSFSAAGNGHNGVLSISRKAVPEEEDVLRIIQFFDDLGSPEMCNLLKLGFEGVHYNVVDGAAVPIPEMQDDQNQKIYMPYAAPMAVLYPDLRCMKTQNTYLQQRIIDVLNENAPYAVSNDALGLISDTYSEVGGDLDTILSDACTQYIMGVIGKEEFQSAIAKWKSAGGDKVAEELAQQYLARQGQK